MDLEKVDNQNKIGELSIDSEESVEFINIQLTSSEATDMLWDMFDNAINFCNVQRLRQWVGNHNADTSYYTDKMADLSSKKTMIKEYLKQVELQGQSVKLKIELNIEIAG
ncbi:MAG: hypothetical protein ACO1PI_14310 [Bacteroidota bacterium]